MYVSVLKFAFVLCNPSEQIVSLILCFGYTKPLFWLCNGGHFILLDLVLRILGPVWFQKIFILFYTVFNF